MCFFLEHITLSAVILSGYPNSEDSKTIIVPQFMSFLDLIQHNTITNCNSRLLELVFTNISAHCNVEHNPEPTVREDTHHPALRIPLDVDIDAGNA